MHFIWTHDSDEGQAPHAAQSRSFNNEYLWRTFGFVVAHDVKNLYELQRYGTRLPEIQVVARYSQMAAITAQTNAFSATMALNAQMPFRFRVENDEWQGYWLFARISARAKVSAADTRLRIEVREWPDSDATGASSKYTARLDWNGAEDIYGAEDVGATAWKSRRSPWSPLRVIAPTVTNPSSVDGYIDVIMYRSAGTGNYDVDAGSLTLEIGKLNFSRDD